MGGNDTYVVDSAGDIADESGGDGTDTVLASVSFGLAGAIEHLTLTGSAVINATGNGLANLLTGNAAANLLDGLGGGDTMRGMGGNDTYVVDSAGDVVDEGSGDGVDLVMASLSFSLASAIGSIENLTLTGSNGNTATGNGLANLLTGNAGANAINGAAGNDIMTGDAGADTFVFDSALDKIANVDHVTDFLHGTDTLLLDASVFAKLKVGDLKKKAFFAKDGASKAKDKQDHIIYDSDSGEVRFDKDGKGKTKAVLFAVLDGGPDLAHTDVLVVA
jgi:Ca2+-binding RTX toxin-like protein